VTTLLIIYLISLTVSTFLSMFEVAILTINPVKVSKLIENKPYLSFFDKNKDKAATDIMIFNFLWDYGSAMFLSALIATHFESNQLLIFVASAATAIGMLYIATLSAKLFASKNSDIVINKLGWLIIGVYWAMKPFIVILSSPILVVLRGVLESGKSDKLSDAEVLGVLAMAKKEGLLDLTQHTLIKRVVNLQSQTVKDLIPESQSIESVNIESSMLELEGKLLSGCHKRIVVTKTHNGKEYPIGILTFNDIVKVNVESLRSRIAEVSGGSSSAYTLPMISTLMHPCVVTRELTQASVLIDKLNKGDHIVVTVDESGVMTGVLQSDDIIQALTS
jgi:putative hemolysin